MKQMEVTQKKIGEHTFYIKPFPAFTAANISGELAKLVAPLVGGLASLADGESNIEDIEVEKAVPVLGDAFSALSGDQVERLMKKLLIDSKNISVEGPASNDQVKILDYDIANEAFCGDLFGMYALCYEVIQLNYGGFFGNLGSRFGRAKSAILKITQTNTED